MIAHIIRLATLCAYALPVWLALRGTWLLIHRKKKPFQLLRELALTAFVIFMAGLVCLLLDGRWREPQKMLNSAVSRLQSGEKIRLRPFQTIWAQLHNLASMDVLTQLVGNVILFIPWGFGLPLFWRRFRTPRLMIFMALGLTCCIEFIQLFIRRHVEVDDMLLNFTGTMIGAGAWLLLHRRWPQMDGLFLAADKG